jgi:hypothetical protein
MISPPNPQPQPKFIIPSSESNQSTPRSIFHAKKGEWEICFANLSSKSECDSNNQTCLHLASAAGNLDIVRKLIEDGYDVNACDRWDWTPLHCASNGRYIGVRTGFHHFDIF